MQLKRNSKKHRKIGGLLATAACSLLNQTTLGQETPGWYLDTAVLGYSEKDRVDAIEPVISATRIWDDGRKLNLKFVIDSLTGASPNGATITDQPQTFTRPSGIGTFVTPAGKLPLDDTFKDTRNAISAQYEFELNRLTRLSTGVANSDEYDYSSVGVNATLARDFNNRNTTLLFGLAFSSDTISPEGDIPVPLASTQLPRSQLRQFNEDEKTVADFLLGVTQVINKNTLMQVNYSFSSSDGYLTEPFKLLSVLDDTSGDTVDYVYENRPDTRDKHSLFWKTKYSLNNGNVIDLSYRYLWDDWDITSHTVDARYRFDVSNRLYVEPHLRYYTQQEAEFYTQSLNASTALPEFASADYRLGAFDGITYGAKLGFRLGRSSEVSARLEFYDQRGDTVGNPIGIQANYDQFPDLDATIFQISYSFKF